MEVIRDCIPPVWSGATGKRIMAELERWQAVIAGSATTYRTPAVCHLYARQIQEQSGYLERLRTEEKRLKAEMEPLHVTETRVLAYEELVKLGVDKLMHSEDRIINQLLHRLLQGYSFVVDHAAIIGIRSNKDVF